MRDKGRIVLGLLVFVLLVTSPVWYNLINGAPGPPPEVELPIGEESCVADRDFMRREHMQLLVDWRDEVVRDGDRIFTTEDGRQYSKSLSGTTVARDGGSCMSCHSNKDAFCDRCHDYLAVQPVCWDCHVAPQGDQP